MINRDGIKKILKITGIVLVIVIILGYSIFTSFNFISGPEITIFEPTPGSTISTSSVLIRGVGTRIQDISMNGRPILIDEKGNFVEILSLSPGYNVSLFTAKDRFDRTIEYKLELVYQEK